MPSPDDPALREALARMAALERETDELRRENQRLRDRALALELDRRRASESGSVDQASGFRNEAALKRYLIDVIGILADVGGAMAMVVYNIDDAERLGRDAGAKGRDDIILRAGAMLRSCAPRDAMAFRMGDSRFAFLLPGADRAKAEAGAASAIASLEAASIHESRVTASAAVESLEDWAVNALDPAGVEESLLELLDEKLRQARAAGGGRVGSMEFACVDSARTLPLVVVVEPDSFNASVIADLLKRRGMDCVWCADGKGALERIMESSPDAIVSELSVPRLGGLAIRRALLDSGRLRGLHRVPFILLSERKDDDAIRQAAALGVTRFIQKPYFTSELLALVEEAVAEGAGAAGRACP